MGLSGVAQESPVIDEQSARHLAAAQAAEKNRDYPAASVEYAEILKLQPKLAIIRQSLAVTYHLENRYLEAIPEFERALRLDPTMWGSCLFLGMDYYKTNQFRLAIAPLEKSIALNGKMAEAEARFWLAATYSALDKPEDAVRELRRDLMLRPEDLDVLYALVKAYDQSAAFAFERLGAIDAGGAAVFLLQAERFLDENRRDLATLQCRSALQLRPDFAGWIPALAGDTMGKGAAVDLSIAAYDARANLQMADLLAESGDELQAVSLLQGLVIQRPANSQAALIIAEAGTRITALQRAANGTRKPVRLENAEYILKGLELIRERRYREAEEPLSHAAAKKANPALQLLLLRAYVESGDWELVEDRLHRLLAAEPGNVDALLLIGRGYKQQAENALQRMIQMDADFYGVHELLGRQHEERTEYDLAIKEYSAALAKRPGLAGIDYAIGNVYRKMSRYAEAERWLTEELARNPYHGLAHYRLGSIYVEQGKPGIAIPHLLQALQSHPQLIDAQLDLGRAYTADGKFDEAIAALKKASRSEPDNDRVHYLLSIAYSKEGRRDDAQSEMSTFHRLTRDRLHRTQEDLKNLSNSLDR